MRKTTFVLVLLIFVLVVTINACLADDNRFGVFVGANYFDKIQKPGYTPVSDERGAMGKYLLDNDGYSGQVGIKYDFNIWVGIQAQYSFKRQCEFDYPRTPSPFVWGPFTSPNTNWSKTLVSEFNIGANIYWAKIKSIKLYTYFGLSWKRIEAYGRYGNVDPSTHEILYIIPENGYNYMGKMNILASSLSLGVELPVYNNISVTLAAEYCSGNIDEWKGGYDTDLELNNQDIDGLRYVINLIYWLL